MIVVSWILANNTYGNLLAHTTLLKEILIREILYNIHDYHTYIEHNFTPIVMCIRKDAYETDVS
jgi:hypothetical protein